jgi:hypothetical protein
MRLWITSRFAPLARLASLAQSYKIGVALVVAPLLFLIARYRSTATNCDVRKSPVLLRRTLGLFSPLMKRSFKLPKRKGKEGEQGDWSRTLLNN